MFFSIGAMMEPPPNSSVNATHPHSEPKLESGKTLCHESGRGILLTHVLYTLLKGLRILNINSLQ